MASPSGLRTDMAAGFECPRQLACPTGTILLSSLDLLVFLEVLEQAQIQLTVSLSRGRVEADVHNPQVLVNCTERDSFCGWCCRMIRGLTGLGWWHGAYKSLRKSSRQCTYDADDEWPTKVLDVAKESELYKIGGFDMEATAEMAAREYSNGSGCVKVQDVQRPCGGEIGEGKEEW